MVSPICQMQISPRSKTCPLAALGLMVSESTLMSKLLEGRQAGMRTSNGWLSSDMPKPVTARTLNRTVAPQRQRNE